VIDGTVIVWAATATLAVVAATAAVVWPLAVKYGTSRAERHAEHEVVQACLWASSPMDVLAFYARYRPNPPDLAAYMDDQVARDPALEARTRRPAVRVRPAVPPSDVVGKEEGQPPPPAAEPVADAAGTAGPAIPVRPTPRRATSHRTMRRPLVGWLEETIGVPVGRAWRRIVGEPDPQEQAQREAEIVMDIDVAVAAKAAELAAASAEVTETSAPAPHPVWPRTDVEQEGKALLDLLRDDATLCPSCKGTRRVHLVSRDPADIAIWQPCPDCCCPWPSCTQHTRGDLCPEHRDADDILEETQAKRRADA
jgi:hypothetical protein